MLLLVVVRIAVVALIALVLAIMSEELLIGWLTIGASAVGLLLLIVDELRQRVQSEAERDNEGTVLPSTRHADISQRGIPDESTVGERSIRAAPACNEGVLRPDLWPPEPRRRRRLTTAVCGSNRKRCPTQECCIPIYGREPDSSGTARRSVSD